MILHYNPSVDLSAEDLFYIFFLDTHICPFKGLYAVLGRGICSLQNDMGVDEQSNEIIA